MDKIIEIFNSPISLIISGISILLGLIFPMRIALRNLRKAQESKYWLTTTGLIKK